MLVLAVQLDEVLAEALEQTDRRRRVVHVDAVPSGAEDLALDDELAVARRVAGLLETARRPGPPGPRRTRPGRCNVLAGSDQIGMRARAEHEQDRVDQDGLARARLPGQHVEARARRAP